MATAGFLALTAAVLLATIMPRRTKVPDVAELREVVDGRRQARFTAIEQLVAYYCPPSGYIGQLRDDSHRRGQYFAVAVALFLVSQVLLVISIGVAP